MRISVLLVCLLACLGMSQAAQASLLVNGDFSAPTIAGSFATRTTASQGITGWTIGGSGVVDHIGIHWNGVSNLQGDQSVDIDFASTLSQQFSTTAGNTYEFSFYYSHNPGSSSSSGMATIDGNSTLLSTGTLTHNVSNTGSNMQWIQYTGTFVADSSMTTLTFTGDQANGLSGWAVDEASITDLGGNAAVPEPASLMVWSLLAMGGAGFVARRRLKKSA